MISTRRGFLTGMSGGVAGGLPALAAAPRQPLRITDVRVTLLSHELKDKSWWTATMEIWKSDAVLVEVFTDKGLVGMGESSPYAGPELLKETIEAKIRPLLLGRNPFDVQSLAVGWAGARSGFAAWAGVDAACWDLIGQAVGKPVYEVLADGAGFERKLRMYASGGVEYAWYNRPQALIEDAVRCKEAGYTAFKFRIGTEWKLDGMTMARYIPWVRRLREAVGPEMDLMQESNMRLTVEECLELAPVLKDLGFLWFEEPVRTADPGAIEQHLRIQEALGAKVRVAGGESRGSRYEFKEWMDRGAYRIVQPDCNVTGLSEAWQIAKMASFREIPCCPHNWHGGLTTMANAALVAATPNRLLLELNQTYNPFKEEIFEEPLVVRKGYLELPRKPGFGMKLKAGVRDRFPYIPGNYWRRNPRYGPA
jgi:galactonate dehydratase